MRPVDFHVLSDPSKVVPVLYDMSKAGACFLKPSHTSRRPRRAISQHYFTVLRLLPNLKALVYRAGAKYGGEDGWQYLWDSYRKASQLETKDFLLSLAATTDAIRLKRWGRFLLYANKKIY